MKTDSDAVRQYEELASALRQIGAEWIIEEVEELVVQGKTVTFRELPPEEQFLTEERLVSETQKGLPVGRAKPTDLVGAPYTPSERLKLLADAAERILSAIAKSGDFIATFAEDHALGSVILQEPTVPGAEAGERTDILARSHRDIEGPLRLLQSLLNRVVE